MKKLAVSALVAAFILGATWLGTKRESRAADGAPPLTPEERAAGLKIGAGWDSFKILSDFETVEAARADLPPGRRVLAIEIDGQARAYPLDILNHHEIVSDTVGGTPLLVSY